MCSHGHNTKFDFIDDSGSLVVFLPGYKRDDNELSFLRDFIVKEKCFSFLYLPYQLVEGSKERPIRKIVMKLVEQINIFFANRKFKSCYLIGYSLGAALALDIAVDYPNKFSGLVLISVFDDRRNLLLSRGIRLARENNISPIRLIKKNKQIRTLFIHGVSDKSVAIERAVKVFDESNKKISKFIPVFGDHYFNDPYSKSLLNKNINEFLKRP